MNKFLSFQIASNAAFIIMILHKDFSLNFHPPFKAHLKLQCPKTDECYEFSTTVESIPTTFQIRDSKVLEKLHTKPDQKQSIEHIFNLTGRIEYPGGTGIFLRQETRGKISQIHLKKYFRLDMDKPC